MRDRLGLFLVLLGTFLVARVVIGIVLSGRPPVMSTLLFFAATIPAVQTLAASFLLRRGRA